MANHTKNCDNQINVGDTPLSPIVSIPSYLTSRQIGLDGLHRKSWKYQKYPVIGALEMFDDPFNNRPNKENRTTLPISTSKYQHGIENVHNYNGIKGRKSLIAHLGCVNALAFGPSGSGTLISAGDDRRVLVWKCPQFEDNDRVRPVALPGEHDSNIFCIDFNGRNETKIFSGGNDERVLVHDTSAGGRTQDIFLHEAAVYGIDGHPMNRDIFVTACADGRVQMFDLRQNSNEDPLLVAAATRPFRPFLGVQFNPCEPRLLITANQKEGARLWDIRQPRKSVLEYGSVGLGKFNGSRWHGDAAERCMAVRFNSNGTRIAALGRRMPPVVYELSSPKPFAEFDSPGYYNSCTMKSICFGGLNDDYVLAGSDDFNLYAWKMPEEVAEGAEKTQLINRASVVLRGHRSIVNQVRYNHSDGTIATAGVEKCIRLWSPFQMPDREQIAGRNDPEKLGDTNSDNTNLHGGTEDRTISSRSNYLRLVEESHTILSHDYTNETTQENPRMLAFFDRLVQREMEDNRFSSSSSSSDGDGPGGTSPKSSSSDSIISHVSDLTESDNEILDKKSDTLIENSNSHMESRGPTNLNSNNSQNVTAIGRFILDNIDSNSFNNDSTTSDNINLHEIVSNDNEGVSTISNTNSGEVIENDEDQSITISNLIAKKRKKLKAYRLKKFKRARKFEANGSRARAANLLTYRNLRYEQKLKMAKKIVSLSDSSSSSSSTTSESDSDRKESDSDKEISNKKEGVSPDSILNSRKNSSDATCRNSRGDNSARLATYTIKIPTKSLKNDSKMRDSILRALKEYETEEEDKLEHKQRSEKDLTCCSTSESELNISVEQLPETSLDIISPQITYNNGENSSEKTDKETYLHNSLQENNCDNKQGLLTEAFNNAACSDIKEHVENNISCDNITSKNSSETGEQLEKVYFKNGGMATKGKRSYRKRKLSDD